ncbi:uncharacterized protein EDB91DRAFT_1086401 [Suillus paluster]|uniref:uncharacterized protein n=1 Tax=Suillus paluster TaxID=48578 RepID=UPI001B85D8DF|nr:uncharacterized protein EDB91DRAFT_1086401 [Suillus paluster]KAG1727457.1 hypothetical protein EDB91DRAFT_1086401 [Suillus paluster]
MSQSKATKLPPITMELSFSVQSIVALYGSTFAEGFGNSEQQAAAHIAMQDHLDGGILIVIHCPGFKANTTPSPEEVALNLYVTPCELQESPTQIGGDVATLVQAFCEEFVVPHMEHFMKHCQIKGIEAPHHSSCHTFQHLVILLGHVSSVQDILKSLLNGISHLD